MHHSQRPQDWNSSARDAERHRPVTFYATEDIDQLISPVHLTRLDVRVDGSPRKHSPSDLWARVRRRLSLIDADNERIDREARFYARRSRHFAHVQQHAERYLYHVIEQIEKRGLPGEVALIPMVESGYVPTARSPSGAAGIWQFIASTGRRFGLHEDSWYDGRRDVQASTRAALDYLERLHRTFDGDWLLALAAYNAGPGTVLQAIKRNRSAGKPTDFWSLQLPAETRLYVPRILAIGRLVQEPEAYGLALRPLPNRPYFTAIEVHSQIDLAQAAKLASASPRELEHLNPGLKRGVTPPKGPHSLLVPVEHASALRRKLASLALSKNRGASGKSRYRVRRGDTLGEIAQNHGTTVAELQRANRLRGTTIRVGQTLVIPAAERGPADQTASAAAS
jgi:membrane-bound lytic murein transglycosylase D